MQPDLFTTQPRFDGATFEPALDADRLTSQLRNVREWMCGGAWHTLRAIARGTGYPEASVSARLRDLRKPKFGGYAVERRRVTGGIYEYRVSA